MFHAASMGGIVGVPAEGGLSVFLPLFDPVGVMDAIEQHKVTMTVMVPTMIGMLMNHAEFRPERLASLRRLTYGASPMPAALLDRLLGAFPDLDIYQGYGMTEASAVLTVLGPEEHRAGGERLRSAGKPLRGVVLSIQDADGKILGPRRDRRGVRTRRQLHARVLEASPTRPPRRSATAGTTPATRATSTSRDTCSSSTG